MSGDKRSEGADISEAVTKLYLIAMLEAEEETALAIELLTKTLVTTAFMQAKKGYERRAVMRAQELVNELFETGLEALDKDLRAKAARA